MFLYGASGHARVIIEILEANNVEIHGLFDDNPDIHELIGYKVIGSFRHKEIPDIPFIISIGNNSIRKKITGKYPLLFGQAFHPSSVISPRVKIGKGSVIMGNAVVNSGSVIGEHVILNTLSSIDHDCILEDFVHISPNACLSGGVTVGEGTHIGSGAVVVPNIKIGKWATIGAGCVVIDNVKDQDIIVGNPGRSILMNKNRSGFI
jgi:sugar O-acyltransferase (sialic acid O-acetyltransferase NeuD family)